MLMSLVEAATTELPAVVLGEGAGDAEVAVFRRFCHSRFSTSESFTCSPSFTPHRGSLARPERTRSTATCNWQSAMWVAVLTFPVLGATTALACSFTVLTLGRSL